MYQVPTPPSRPLESYYYKMVRERWIDGFKGSDGAYIHYLETNLEESRRHVS
jgi:hypothetical protein